MEPTDSIDLKLQRSGQKFDVHAASVAVASKCCSAVLLVPDFAGAFLLIWMEYKCFFGSIIIR